jgi:hypothetical protein
MRQPELTEPISVTVSRSPHVSDTQLLGALSAGVGVYRHLRCGDDATLPDGP